MFIIDEWLSKMKSIKGNPSDGREAGGQEGSELKFHISERIQNL